MQGFSASACSDVATFAAVQTPTRSPRAVVALPLFTAALRSNPSCNSQSLTAKSSGLRLSPIRAMAEAGASTAPPPPARKYALISLSDKRNLAILGSGLQELGYTIVSTGGTASSLASDGVSVTKVEDLTGFPEMLDGRVKTLHPAVHGGILARRDLDHHMEALDKHKIGTIDIVVVNLYPFYEKVSSSTGISFEDAIENIDIGGPTMIRSAAKGVQVIIVFVSFRCLLVHNLFFPVLDIFPKAYIFWMQIHST